ncbi:AAA family ATPase [Timonella sp. A28]|uniref:AAA family ATPase n=1 Tax=Timonella sp. A28 TaxID=3442640 RepID=UPI003EB7034A
MTWQEPTPQWPHPEHDPMQESVEIRVMTAVLGSVDDHIVEILAGHPTIVVARRCADAAELLGAARAGLGVVALISSDLPGFDRSLVHELESDGVSVIAINDPTDQFSQERLRAIGIKYTLTAHAMSTDLVSMLSVALGAGSDKVPEWQDILGTAHQGQSNPHDSALQDDLSPVADPTPEKLNNSGKIITVWGTYGAPGRSMIAAGLAFQLAAQEGNNTLLIDADTYAPSHTQGLGLLEESSGLALAARAAGQGTLTVQGLKDFSSQLNTSVSLLTGLPRTARWPEISPSALESIYEHAKHEQRWVVVDCAPNVEEDEVLSFDTKAPQRNAATITSLSMSDLVLIVGRGDAIGIKRLIDMLESRKDMLYLAGIPYLVVVNQCGVPGTPATQRAEITEALRTYSGELDPLFISYDPVAAQHVIRHGVSPTETRKKSMLRTDIEALTAVVKAGFHGHDESLSGTANRKIRVT